MDEQKSIDHDYSRGLFLVLAHPKAAKMAIARKGKREIKKSRPND